LSSPRIRTADLAVEKASYLPRVELRRRALESC
jgi:hypothetical protein